MLDTPALNALGGKIPIGSRLAPLALAKRGQAPVELLVAALRGGGEATRPRHVGEMVKPWDQTPVRWSTFAVVWDDHPLHVSYGRAPEEHDLASGYRLGGRPGADGRDHSDSRGPLRYPCLTQWFAGANRRVCASTPMSDTARRSDLGTYRE